MTSRFVAPYERNLSVMMRWHQALVLEQPDQQSLGRLGVTTCVNDFLGNIAVLIDRMP